MRISVYVHQWNQLQARTLEAIGERLRANGITELRPKSHQWTTWTGHFDSGGAADITSLEELARVRDVLGRYGVRVVPWCVPMGLDIEPEAQRAAEVARVCGAIDCDVEPYEEFWPALPQGDYSAVEPYFKRVRELVGDQVEITLDFPARDSSWEWGKVKEAVRLAAPFVDRLALQSYFGVEQARDAERRTRELVGGALPIDHIADAGHLGEMLAWLGERGAERTLIWRLADMGDAEDSLARGAAGGVRLVPPRLVSAIVEQNQFVRANYDTKAEFDSLGGAACSAASLAAALTGYGIQANISEGIRRIRATGDDILANGLQNRNGQGQALVDALNAAGIKASKHASGPVTRQDLMDVLDSGRPVICQMNNYYGAGHYLVGVAVLPDRSGVAVADSNTGPGKRALYRWADFWKDVGSGVLIWADLVEQQDGDDEEDDLGLREELAAERERTGGLTIAVAHLADTEADRLRAEIAAEQGSVKAKQARVKEVVGIREQFLGPRP